MSSKLFIRNPFARSSASAAPSECLVESLAAFSTRAAAAASTAAAADPLAGAGAFEAIFSRRSP